MGPTDRSDGDPVVARRFRIVGLLGQGGFGVVYRAVLETSDGASQTVALKVLHHGMGDDVLRRFRDEARMLALIEDRAIVSVQQPTQIDGSWVIVMECVEGATVAQLLADSAVPPRPALTIVGEIARALHHVYHQPGSDGRPLELLHRDLKTSNILLTPDGDVRLLDFGIARASFEGREASTLFGSDVIGTPGYVAPERFESTEGPEGDVFSLGITLYVMLTGTRATRIDRRILDRIEDPGSRAALALALQMCEPEPAERPTAREVHQRCRELASQTPGSALATWAWRRVPPAMAEARRKLEAQASGDPPALLGAVLVEPDAGPGALPSGGAAASGHPPASDAPPVPRPTEPPPALDVPPVPRPTEPPPVPGPSPSGPSPVPEPGPPPVSGSPTPGPPPVPEALTSGRTPVLRSSPPPAPGAQAAPAAQEAEPPGSGATPAAPGVGHGGDGALDPGSDPILAQVPDVSLSDGDVLRLVGGLQLASGLFNMFFMSSLQCLGLGWLGGIPACFGFFLFCVGCAEVASGLLTLRSRHGGWVRSVAYLELASLASGGVLASLLGVGILALRRRYPAAIP